MCQKVISTNNRQIHSGLNRSYRIIHVHFLNRGVVYCGDAVGEGWQQGVLKAKVYIKEEKNSEGMLQEKRGSHKVCSVHF